MLADIALTPFLGMPLVVYFGIITLLSFLFTAAVAFLNFNGVHFIPFSWHPRMALFSIILALIHGLFGLSIFLNF